MVEHKRYIVALLTLATLLIELIHILLKWKHIQGKQVRHFGHYDAKAKLFCQKSPSYGDLGCKNRGLGNWASLASHMYMKIFTKKRVMRQDLGNRASPCEITLRIPRNS